MTPQAAMLDTRAVSDMDRREAFCRQVVRSAGVLALEGYLNRTAGSFEMKGPQDYLTETDAAVEAHLRARVAEAFPSDGFIGEEGGGQARADNWVVDPIDGTANFARGIPHFCISIAFISGNQIELGAIYNPPLDELYFARRGMGASRNGEPISVAATTKFEQASVELGWSNRRSNETYVGALAAMLERGANVRRGASGALGLAYVADGRSDAYAEHHMNAWDCLAGLLLVREAGGVVAPFLEHGGLVEGAAVLATAPGVARGVSEATGIALD